MNNRTKGLVQMNFYDGSFFTEGCLSSKNGAIRSVRFGLSSFTFETNSVRGSFESESDVKKGPEATKTAEITLLRMPFEDKILTCILYFCLWFHFNFGNIFSWTEIETLNLFDNKCCTSRIGSRHSTEHSRK